MSNNKIILCVFIMMCIFLSGCNEENYLKESTNKKYVQENIINLDLNDDDFKALEPLKSDFDNYNLYFLGEYHAIQKNFDAEFYFLKYFCEKYDVKYILCESGFSITQLLNRYLETGDTSIITDMLSDLKGTPSYSKDYYNYLENIYEYNKTLPEDKKLTFVGIDIQHQQDTGIEYLLSIIPEKEAQGNIKESIDYFKNAFEDNNQRNGDLQYVFKDIIDNINKFPEEYSNYFGEEYFNFKFACENIFQSIDFYYINNQNQEMREDYITSNFNTLYEHNPEGKILWVFWKFSYKFKLR